MPFGRKKKKSLLTGLFNIFRAFFVFSRTRKYISLSIKRIKGSPQALSLGLATGVSISFTPFIGLHALLALFISWVIGGSMAAALIGTLFGNPWTFPFIWYLTYEIGQIINYGFFSYNEEFSFQSIKKEVSTVLGILKNIIIFANMVELEESFEELKLIPFMIIGSIPFVIITWILSYFSFLNIFKSYRNKVKKNKKL
ncbi:MAG: hypothetical protein CMJ06_06095 [Pelagibacterales bacterium]|nr:hypothetical protein [Pelagibacterales bacterium]OUU61205.1 MAG: hypothetical protein CBC22_08240 [Alphaproteobacteria bacterium TMED62]|tara:strand:+ start:5124 stop:5717 length:594 start_codon:yes stop_codon:yes gene_type:complete